MKPVESSVVINRPIEACFSYLTDLANDLEWRREWIEAVKTTDGPHGVGAQYRLTGALLGRRIATVYEAIAYEPTRLAAWKAVSGPLPLTFSRISRASKAAPGSRCATRGTWAVSSGSPPRSSPASAGDSWKATTPS